MTVEQRSRIEWLMQNIDETDRLSHLEKFPWAADFKLPNVEEAFADPSTIHPSRFSVLARAREYMQKIDSAIAGQHGHDKTYYAACRLVHGFGLTQEEAYPIMLEYSARCVPPWSENEIRHKLEDSHRAPGPRGYLLESRPKPPRQTASQEQEPPEFATPKLSSELTMPEDQCWLWENYLASDCITLLTALPKSGKTTLLASLIKEMESGGKFCDLTIEAGHVLYLTEEPEGLWVERRDRLGLGDNIHWLIRPIRQACDWSYWVCFLQHIAKLKEQIQPKLIVFDTLPDMWPVKKENEAPEVIAALKPLRDLSGCSILLVHHNRKSDGQEGTAARGSGALAGYVDTIVEYRRYDQNDDADCRRVLRSWGRAQGTVNEIVVELANGQFQVQGAKQDVRRGELLTEILAGLPPGEPGITAAELRGMIDSKPSNRTLFHALKTGVERGGLGRSGEGVKGSPFRYWNLTAANGRNGDET